MNNNYQDTEEFKTFLKVAEELRKQLENPQVWSIAKGKLDESYAWLKDAAQRAFDVMYNRRFYADHPTIR